MAITIELLALSLLIVAGSGHQLKNETENVRVLKIVSTGSERNLKGEITGSDRNVSRETVGNDQFVHAMLGTKITVRPGRHVCTAEKVTSRPVKVTKTYKKPIYTNHPRDCSDFNNCPQFEKFFCNIKQGFITCSCVMDVEARAIRVVVYEPLAPYHKEMESRWRVPPVGSYPASLQEDTGFA